MRLPSGSAFPLQSYPLTACKCKHIASRCHPSTKSTPGSSTDHACRTNSCSDRRAASASIDGTSAIGSRLLAAGKTHSILRLREPGLPRSDGSGPTALRGKRNQFVRRRSHPTPTVPLSEQWGRERKVVLAPSMRLKKAARVLIRPREGGMKGDAWGKLKYPATAHGRVRPLERAPYAAKYRLQHTSATHHASALHEYRTDLRRNPRNAPAELRSVQHPPKPSGAHRRSRDPSSFPVRNMRQTAIMVACAESRIFPTISKVAAPRKTSRTGIRGRVAVAKLPSCRSFRSLVNTYRQESRSAIGRAKGAEDGTVLYAMGGHLRHHNRTGKP